MYHMEMDYTVFTYALIIFVSEYYVRKYTLISIRQFLLYKVLGSKMNKKEWSFFDSAFARLYQASHVCLEKNNKQRKSAMEP